MFSSIKRQVFNCFHMLQERVLRWITPSTNSQVFGTLADLARGKAELLAENAVLAATTHYLAPTGKATSVHKDGPVSPGVFGRDDSNLETCALPRPTRYPSTLAS
jgi:hypothetical protein